MCSPTCTATPVNFVRPSSTASSIIKPAGTQPGKTKCIECDGYECCCLPIPCTIM